MQNIENSHLNHRTMMRSATIVALLLALCFVIYSSTIYGYFLADDFAYVQLYYRKNLSVLSTILAADCSQGIWGVRARLSEILSGANWDKTWQAEINIASP